MNDWWKSIGDMQRTSFTAQTGLDYNLRSDAEGIYHHNPTNRKFTYYDGDGPDWVELFDTNVTCHKCHKTNLRHYLQWGSPPHIHLCDDCVKSCMVSRWR